MYAHFTQLDDEALLHISGPDSLTFLQGQTTCDTRTVSAEQAVSGAYCTPQGRMVCDFLLAALGEDHFGLRMRADVVPAAAEAFGKYILFSKAELDASRDDWRVFALWGEDAAAALQASLGQAPNGQLGVASGDGLRLVQLDEAGEQFEAWIDMANHAGHLDTLSGAFQEGQVTDWADLQVAAGRARVEGATSGMFLPQDLNYDRTGLVNFTKGCYTGQEIVARLHYRGKPKRRTYPAKLDISEQPVTGAAIHADAGEQSVGNLVNSGGHSALVCVAQSALGKALTLGSANGPALEVGPSPYPLEDDED